MRFLGTVFFVFAALAEMALIAQGQETHPASEQTLFSTSGSLQHPVTVTAEVLKAILGTHPAKETWDILNDSERANPSQLFQAAEVHLRRSDQVDLVVIGMGRMRGADTSWFWVVRSARKDPDVILFGGGDSLELLTSKTKGYKDIGIVWMSSLESGTTVYNFDGNYYKMRTANDFKILTNPTSP